MPIVNELAVTAFFYDHGIEFDFATPEHFSLLLDIEKVILSENPLRIRMTIQKTDEALDLTLNDQLDLVATERSG